jgi:hypothetical protein
MSPLDRNAADTATCRAVILVAATFVCAVTAEPLPAQMTAQEFSVLPEPDQRSILVASLQQWQQATRNMQAKFETRVYNVEYQDGVTGDFKEDVSRYVCELRRKEGRHWASIAWFLPGDDPGAPLAQVVTSMDTEAGVARSIAEHRQMKGVYGAINTKEDNMIGTGRLHYWFDARFGKAREFPIMFLLEHQNSIRFEGTSDDGQSVVISLLYESTSGTPFQDLRTVWLDPQRGFMPVRMHRRWEYDVSPRPAFYQIWDVEVTKMRQIDEIWFPVHFTETATSSGSIKDGYAGVYETTVDLIHLGKMTDADLSVEFPEGVQVHDRIKGVRFVADALTQSAPLTGVDAGVPHNVRSWLILGNLGVLAVIGALCWLGRSRKVRKVPER